MICPNCTQKIDEGAAFCGNCGFALAAAPHAVPTGTTQPMPAIQPAATQQPGGPTPTGPIDASKFFQGPALPAANTVQQTQSQGIPEYAIPSPSTEPASGRGKSGTALVLAILSLFVSWLIPIIGFGFAIAGIVLGSLSLQSNKGKGTASIVLGCLGIIAAILAMIVYAQAATQVTGADATTVVAHTLKGFLD